MNNSAIKSMMNPIRIKIIQELTLKNEATTKQLQEACGYIPQATLYRHLNVLVKNDIIEVASFNQVRGIQEKVYKIKNNPSIQINKDVEKLSKIDLSDIFSQFTLSLLSDFQHYMSKEDALDHITKNIGFRSTTLLLTDTELIELMREINSCIQKRLDNAVSEGRKLRKISTVVTTS